MEVEAVVEPGAPAVEIKQKEPKKKPLYVAFDIEKKGSSLAHEILQIGVAWSEGLDQPIKTESFCFVDTGPWEQRCYDEFWIHHRLILDRIRDQAIESKEGWKAFKFLLDTFEANWADVRIVSDNPAYDLGHIDHNLMRTTGRLFGVRFTTAGGYRWVYDPSERIKGLPPGVRQRIKKRVNKECPHTHWAAEDAKSILMTHFFVQEAIRISDEAEAQWDALFSEPKKEAAVPASE